MARQKWEAVDEKFKLGCENYTHRQFIFTAMLIAKTWQLYMHEKIRNMMDRVQEINFAFSYSAERTHQFRASLEATPHQLEKRSKLRKLCETRWSARVDDLYTFMAIFDVFVGAYPISSAKETRKPNLIWTTCFHFLFLFVWLRQNILSRA